MAASRRFDRISQPVVALSADRRPYILKPESDAVADAISIHLNIHVPVEEHGTLAFLVARGAVCNVFGAGVSRMSSESVREPIARYSREDLNAASVLPGAGISLGRE